MAVRSVVRGRHLGGMLKMTVMQGRRETVYKMLSRRHGGKVPCYCCRQHVEPADATLSTLR